MAEGGVSPEDAGIAVSERTEIKLEENPFQQAKARIENSKRLKEELIGESAEEYPEQKQVYLDQMTNVEKALANPKSPDYGFRELVVDASGYQEQRFNATYVSPSGEKITEPLVVFGRLGLNGQWEFLEVPEYQGGISSF